MLGTITGEARSLSPGGEIEVVPVPWEAWSQRRSPLRYVGSRFLRRFGVEIPEVDVRSVCRRMRLDLAYFTTPAFVRIDIPFIFTLWDVGHRTIPEFPEMRSGRVPWTQREALCQRMLSQASYVVVGNRTGADEAREFFGLSAQKIVAAPFPNPDFSTVAEESPRWLPEQPFFLYPAQFWPHKNHFTLLKALVFLSTSGRPVPHLVLTGSDQGNLAYLKTAAAAMGVAPWVHFPGFVSRSELKMLYRKATGLVFPSLLGPNNLPPQEAAVLGCPIILSDLAGHREQLGEGALYAPPLDAEAWGCAMQRLMSEAELRAALASRAKIAVAGYTPEAYAAQIGQLLVRLATCRMLWGG